MADDGGEDSLVSLRHLTGLALTTIQELLAPAYDPAYAESLPKLLEQLAHEERLDTARCRALVVRIAGDAVSVGASRLARTIAQEPLTHDLLQQAQATLALTTTSLRTSGMLPPPPDQPPGPQAAP